MRAKDFPQHLPFELNDSGSPFDPVTFPSELRTRIPHVGKHPLQVVGTHSLSVRNLSLILLDQRLV